MCSFSRRTNIVDVHTLAGEAIQSVWTHKRAHITHRPPANETEALRKLEHSSNLWYVRSVYSISPEPNGKKDKKRAQLDSERQNQKFSVVQGCSFKSPSSVKPTLECNFSASWRCYEKGGVEMIDSPATLIGPLPCRLCCRHRCCQTKAAANCILRRKRPSYASAGAQNRLCLVPATALPSFQLLRLLELSCVSTREQTGGPQRVRGFSCILQASAMAHVLANIFQHHSNQILCDFLNEICFQKEQQSEPTHCWRMFKEYILYKKSYTRHEPSCHNELLRIRRIEPNDHGQQ
jgi:hypothetical protein